MGIIKELKVKKCQFHLIYPIYNKCIPKYARNNTFIEHACFYYSCRKGFSYGQGSRRYMELG